MAALRQPRERRGALSGLAAVAFVVALAATGASAETNGSQPQGAASALMAPGPLPDIVEGSAAAPATIIEYASMTCSHCAAFHKSVWPALKAKYIETGKAKFILREFPLDPLATAAFMLARCAGPEKRDAFISRLFDDQAAWAFAANPLYHLKAEAAAGGLSGADFDACLRESGPPRSGERRARRGCGKSGGAFDPDLLRQWRQIERGANPRIV